MWRLSQSGTVNVVASWTAIFATSTTCLCACSVILMCSTLSMLFRRACINGVPSSLGLPLCCKSRLNRLRKVQVLIFDDGVSSFIGKAGGEYHITSPRCASVDDMRSGGGLVEENRLKMSCRSMCYRLQTCVNEHLNFPSTLRDAYSYRLLLHVLSPFVITSRSVLSAPLQLSVSSSRYIDCSSECQSSLSCFAVDAAVAIAPSFYPRV